MRFGKPDLFITMTYDLKWKEFTENFETGEVSENRPDLVVRVFKFELKELMDEIAKDLENKCLCSNNRVSKKRVTSCTYDHYFRFKRQTKGYSHSVLNCFSRNSESKFETCFVQNYKNEHETRTM